MSDLIDRQAALDALADAMPSLTTPDGCGQFDHDIQVTDEAYVDCMRIIHDLPSAQPDVPDTNVATTDTISRQAAIDELVRWGKIPDYNDGERNVISCTIGMLSALPSAQPSVSKTEIVEDCISRQAAINAICEDGTRLERQGQYSMTMVERKQRDADILEALPPAQPGWIPTLVRLPEDNEEVLFCDNEGERWLGWHYGFWKTERLDFDEDDVVAWMPLPEPYKEKQDE